MELELGLKITKNLQDICTDFRLAKDRGGTIFVSDETWAMFILTGHLKGYKGENIKIDINEDATLITISGEKQVQEMVMKGLMMHKKEIELKRFTKVFQIPLGVCLDRVKAKFNEIDSTLTIYMPKLSKGIIGGGIQEIKDEKIIGLQEKQRSGERNDNKNYHKVEEIREEKGGASSNNRHEKDEEEDSLRKKKSEKNEGTRTVDDQNELHRSDSKCSTLFSPCFFLGGAFIVSLVVLVCSFVKLKRR